MMMGPMKKKMVTVGVIAFLIPTVIAGLFFVKYRADKQKEIDSLKSETMVVQRYVFSGDLPVNHIIGENDIKMVGVKEVSSPIDAYSIVPDNDILQILGSPIGRKLKIPVFDKTIVTESMFYTEDDEVERDERKKEFNMITLPSDLEAGDYIDVRMLCPTGEDYLVVTGKEVLSIGLNADTNTIVLDLTEEELIRLSAAIIESYVQDSINIYAVKYVNSNQQLFEETEMDYVERYTNAVEELISGDYALAYAEAIAGLEPLKDENGEVKRNESGEVMYPEVDIERKTVYDYTTEEIAQQAGVDFEIIKRIREANGDVSVENTEKDEKLLTYYRNQTVVISEPLVANYPIKTEIYGLIQRNPNILDTIKAKYNVEELIAERTNLVYTGVYKTDDYTGEIEEDTGVLSAIASNLDKEIETQKAERKEYLQNMLRSSIYGN